MSSLLRNMRNIKWELVLHFMAATVSVVASSLVLWYYLSATLPVIYMWIVVASVAVIIGAVVGLYSALGFQRKVNRLHFAILQLSRGNFTERIPVAGIDSFDKLYYDFNEMAESLEQRIELLQKLGEENVRLQASSTEAAVLEERKRLARDLHDTVSQQLFALHLSASTLTKVMEADIVKAKVIADQLTEGSSIAQKQIRGLIAQLRPTELEGRSLEQALERWFPDYCRHNQLAGEMDIRLATEMSDAVEHQLFMIVQEAMANVVKHARASHVELTLREMDHQYVLNIVDDGRGFYKGQVQTHSFGLSTMRERAQKLGGDIEILSKAGSGTRIKVQIPKFQSRERAGDGQ
jgi:two-component system, NarL family, sensor histidine kinase LiaS